MKAFGMSRSTPWIFLFTALAPGAWGTTYVVTSQLLPEGFPLWSGVIRALPAGILAVLVGRGLPRGVWRFRAFILGALNIGAFFPLLFVAAYRLPSGVAGIFGAASPLLVAVIGAIVLSERPSTVRLFWGMAAAVGVMVMVLDPSVVLDPIGVGAGLASAASMAGGIVLSKKWRPPVGPVTYAGWQLTLGSFFMLPLAVLVEGIPPVPDYEGLLGYVWLSIGGTFVAYSIWFYGLSELPPESTSFLAVVSPLVAAILGIILLGERLTVVQAVGFTLALFSVIASQVRRAHPI